MGGQRTHAIRCSLAGLLALAPALALVLAACNPATHSESRARELARAGTEAGAAPPSVFIESQTGTSSTAALTLQQAVFDVETMSYVFGHGDAIPEIHVAGTPADADPTRVAMLHDGRVYRLYMFQAGSTDTIYQFGFNPATSSYEFGFESIPTLRISGAPADASTDSFAMLHDGLDYRLYLRSRSRETLLYQFAYNPGSRQYEYGYNSIATLEITGSPADADHRRWAMLHDGLDYRYYALAPGNALRLYQFAYNPSTGTYAFGFDSIDRATSSPGFPELPVTGAPATVGPSDFAMLHDGTRYRLYFPGAD